MATLTVSITLLVAGGAALVLMRVDPVAGNSRHLPVKFAVLAILAAAVVMGMSLSRSPMVEASGVHSL